MSQEATLENIYKLLAERKIAKSEEDLYIQYPTAIEEMQVPANSSIVPVNRRINKRLRAITVSIPENGLMEIYNNNVKRMFFSNESGTLEFPNGLYMEDMEVWLTNAGSEAARFNFRMIFTQ